MNRQLFRNGAGGRVVVPFVRGTIGIIGAGKAGTTLARLALRAGWRVLLSGSPRQPLQALIVETLVPGARLVGEAELAAASDVVVLAVPFGKADTVGFDRLAGKVVVDAMNYWYPVDGVLPEVEAFEGSTSEFTLARNPRMRLVKSFNHLGYHDLETDARPAGHPHRRAVAVASDDPDARALVARLVDDLGFDPVTLSLADGVHLQEGGPVFGVPLSRQRLRAALGTAGAQPDRAA